MEDGNRAQHFIVHHHIFLTYLIVIIFPLIVFHFEISKKACRSSFTSLFQRTINLVKATHVPTISGHAFYR
jgi:hypothetical protein